MLPDEDPVPDDEPLEELPLLPEELLAIAPPSGGGCTGGTTAVHVPWIEPGGARQGSPSQQSAFVVQDWVLIWQAGALH